MVLQGHARPLLCLDWSPDGYTLATGAEDNTVRVWDIRARKCTYVLPAHTNLVTGLKIWHSDGGIAAVQRDEDENEPRVNGEADEDGDVEMGSPTKPAGPFANGGVGAQHMAPIQKRSEDETIKLGVLDGSYMVTCSYDGTAKMWSAGDWKPLKTFAGHDGKVVAVDVSDGEFGSELDSQFANKLTDKTHRREICGDGGIRPYFQTLGERFCPTLSGADSDTKTSLGCHGSIITTMYKAH